MEMRGRCRTALALAFATLATLAMTSFWLASSQPSSSKEGWFQATKASLSIRGNKLPSAFPEALLSTVYSPQDFVNSEGISPSFWDKRNSNNTWGPCYPPKRDVDWDQQIQKWYGTNETDFRPLPFVGRTETSNQREDLSGLCRPGFIIIGAGKCGTSSLYHYLVGHPRVLPASEKQIHYFKYYAFKPLTWYLSHFPTAISFLSAGALMTGEASPGYMPYPDVAALTAQKMPGSKIIAVGRNPIDRSWSSYNYNYVNPVMSMLQKGRVRGVSKGLSDESYQQYLFSFEDMMRAELNILKECFATGGPGAEATKQSFGHKPWATTEFDRRQANGLPPLIDMDDSCYGKRVSRTVPRKQWAHLVEKYPDKVINTPNLFLTQALIGRSLYVLPLEWWYMVFPKEDIYFICTEEMRVVDGGPLNQLGQFLGLPSHDFSGVVSAGMYNVGGHKGYDTAISWEQVQKERNSTKTDDIPLSNEFRQELLEFIRPYNERLFSLVGRRCNW